MKINIKNKKAQASVEYILMIALVAGLVLGLMQFSAPIDKTLEKWKYGARDQIAGISASSSSAGTFPSRSDFIPPGVKLNGGGKGGAGSTGSEGSNGNGGEGAGEGGAGGKGAAGAAGKGAGDVGANAPGATATTKGSASGTGGSGAGGSDGPTDDEMESTRRPEAGAGANQISGGGANGAAGEEAAVAGEEAGAEPGSQASLLRKKQQGAELSKSKTLAEKDWSIGKFLIILVVLIFFIVIILKARQARD